MQLSNSTIFRFMFVQYSEKLAAPVRWLTALLVITSFEPKMLIDEQQQQSRRMKNEENENPPTHTHINSE